jgi:hypothetical protein
MKSFIYLVKHTTGNYSLKSPNQIPRNVIAFKVYSGIQLFFHMENIKRYKPNAIIYRPNKKQRLVTNYTRNEANEDFDTLRPQEGRQIKINFNNK